MRLAFIVLFLAPLLFFCCTDRTDPGTNASQIKVIDSTDRAFSDVSKEKGMRSAFLEYMDSGAVLLRPNHNPIVADSAFKFIQNQTDSSFTLTWEPLFADMSSSADLGYTYGIYTFTNKDTSFKGTYTTIWKKQKAGGWKFVLDTGNPGLSQRK